MLYRDKDPVMAADGLLAPMAIIFCIFCAKPQRRWRILLNSPVKKSTWNETVFSCVFVD